MTQCLGCHATIGPTESRSCPTHRRETSDVDLTHADYAVLALEASEVPLSVYDIGRYLQSTFGWQPSQQSLNSTVAQDQRCCWAGPGVYGLWRHGLFPGPRRLVDVARVLLLARSSGLTLDELVFALRYRNYQFQPATLRRAIAHMPAVDEMDRNFYVSIESTEDLAYELRLSEEALSTVVNRVRRQTSVALRERQRRLVVEPDVSDEVLYGAIEARGPFG